MALSINIPGGGVQLSGNPIYIKIAGLSKPVGATNYKAILKLSSANIPSLSNLPPDAIAPDAANEALFDISGLVDQPFMPEFQFPNVGVVTSNPRAAWNINIQYGETYIDSGGTLVVSWNPDNTNHIIVLKGGISDLRIGEYNDANTTFFEEWISAGKFLTNQPNNQKVSPGQIVKLWYLSPSINTVNAEWNCSIETNLKIAHIPKYGAVDLYSFQNSESPTGLAEFSVNPDFLGFTFASGEWATSFTFWLSTIAGDITERRTFIVDNDYKENNNYLYVANSLGGAVDVIWLTGKVELSVDVSGTEGIKPLQPAFTAKTGSIVATSRSGRRKWKINTGYKSLEEINAMLDVCLARHLWLNIDNKLIPVLLANGDKLLSDTMSDIHEIELELLEAHNLRFT